MNLNYDKIKQKIEHGGNHWTSYSDLFLVLSVVFLLLYILANLRTGTVTVAQQAQLIQAKQEAENLQKQIKAYDVLKDDYLKDGASGDEIRMYRQLMDHMDLLQTEAKQKRDELYKQAHAEDDKFKGLNSYQQLVRNIINANLVSSGKVKKRDMVISDQDQNIEGLNKTVSTQESQIAQNNDTIEKIQEHLKKQIDETRFAYRSKKHSKEKMDREIARLTTESQRKIESLREQTSQTEAQLNQTKQKLAEKSHEAQQLVGTLQAKQTEYQNSISELNRRHEEQMVRDKQRFEESMNELKLSADERLAQEKAYLDAEAKKNESYKNKLADLNGELEHTRGKIGEIEGKYKKSIASLEDTNKALGAEAAQKEAQLQGLSGKLQGLNGQVQGLNGELAKTKGQMSQMQGNYEKWMKSLQEQNRGLAGDLASTQQKLNEQKVLAETIKKNFAKAGISASVDGKTGDVVINFKNEYFDTGSSNLKNGMKDILKKTFPVYAKSLMQNPAIAKKIGSVEIVGFASPTYKGKYVDPKSLSPGDRDAVNYNMDLSYQRAKSIFEHVFDTTKMAFKYQTELLPMVKVSGRSYLASDRLDRSTASAPNDGYCTVYDCKKSQRVIIKFNLRDE